MQIRELIIVAEKSLRKLKSLLGEIVAWTNVVAVQVSCVVMN